MLTAFPEYLYHAHQMDMKPSRSWYCRIIVFVILPSVQCSTYLIIAMSFERFYSIIRPHKAASFNTVKRAKVIITLIFVFNFLYGIPCFFIGGTDGRFCVPNAIASVNFQGKLYYWLTELISFILPFVSLLTMDSVIIHTLKQRSKLKFSERERNRHNSRGKNVDKQIFTMLLLVTFGYLILTTPAKLVMFYLNFYSGNTPLLLCGASLVLSNWRKDFLHKSWNQLLSVRHVWSEIPHRFKESVLVHEKCETRRYKFNFFPK